MKNLLSRENVEVLAQLAFSRVLLAFDFDGTLAPIIEDRRGARMRPETSTLFAAVCAAYPCAVISGRTKRDVEGRLVDAPVKYVMGNHGLESGALSDEMAVDIREARHTLEAALATEPGIDVEDKRCSLALHYRRARNRRRARHAIVQAVSAVQSKVRMIPGKLVFNVLPAGAPNKGDALLELRAREQADTALYVGDDVTDEDVFELDQPGRLVSVRVGASRSSAAAYFLRDQRAIDALLKRLLSSKRTGVSP